MKVSRSVTSPTEIEDDGESWTGDDDLARSMAALTTCHQSESLPLIDNRDNVQLVSHIKESWKPGEVCAEIQEIQARGKDTSPQELSIMDRCWRYYTKRVDARTKYAFVFVDGTIRLFITHQETASTIATYIDPSNITEDRGFIFSGVIEFFRQVEHPVQIPEEEFRELNHTLVAISVRYCQILAAPEYALTLHNNDFVHRQLSFCGLYLRTLSPEEQVICRESAYFGSESIFPRFGKLGPAMIQDECIRIVVSWEDQVCTVLMIQRVISELNELGYFFLAKGDVDVGRIRTIPHRYAKVAPISQ